MWADETVFYQIYPLGFCGAPFENDGVQEHRVLKVLDWVEHLRRLHVGALYLCPVFSSDTHGYNTRDFFRIDERLGTNADFQEVCRKLHESGIRVVLDGVFNHVGRGFWAFQDVLRNRERSPYIDWFYIDLGGNSCYDDGLWYEGWEGNYDLVKLNLRKEAVVEHLLEAVRFWVQEFGIDGLRLDVAYCLDKDFLRRLRAFCSDRKEDFFLLGEMLHGDYRERMNGEMLHSATNYECYKGLYSSFNSMNLFEINHSLQRQFGAEDWCLYRGAHLFSFVDNHDVTRAASILQNERHLPLLYALCFGMPGIPCVYYGSEWGARGRKEEGDRALRPCFAQPEWNGLTDWIARLAEVKRAERALNWGAFRSVVLTNRQCIFERRCGEECVWVAVNADEQPYWAAFDAPGARAADLLSGREVVPSGGMELPPYSAAFWKWQN
ncbi:cyclomaltodextrinase [bacterium 210917-DFI.7.65]|nr:cyclomaltodextrinase [Clostridiales bacterium]MCB6900547.1 cyclomaltodextrinase [bacterium 210917-DFI.7.65]